MTPLHLAVGYALRSGDNSIVKTLSEYNADFTAQDEVCVMCSCLVKFTKVQLMRLNNYNFSFFKNNIYKVLKTDLN